MGADAKTFLERWHRIVAEKDLDGLLEVLAEQSRIGAPPYWAKFEGRDLVHHLLTLVIDTIEGFTYHREWVNGSELALEFRGSVDGLDLQGIDLITLDDESRLVNIDVMIRPMNAIEALREHVAPRMQAFLASRSSA